MKINGEEVELVTSFDQLRAGMIVWAKPCRWCNGAHRGFLTKLVSGRFARFPDGSKLLEPFWLFLPLPSCAASGCVSVSTVLERRAYLVVDPLLDAQSTEHARKLVTA